MKKGLLVLVIAKLEGGGAARVLSVLSKEMLDFYETVEIVTWIDAPIGYTIDKRVHFLCIEKEIQSKNLLSQIGWFRKHIKTSKPTTVLSFLAKFNILSLISLIGVSTPIFVADRSNPNFDFKNPILHILRWGSYLLCAEKLIVQTNKNKSYYSRLLQSKTIVIPNPNILSVEKIGSALRATKSKRIVSVGRLIYAKNQEMLIRAFAAIVDNFPDYTLIIYGEGKLRNHLEKIVEELSLKERVLLPGNADNIHERIADASLFVFPSRWEGMPNALIEAMCLGLPVISTDISGVNEFIDNGENGIIIPSNNVNALIKSMRFLLSDTDTANRFAQKAILVAEKVNITRVKTMWKAALLSV